MLSTINRITAHSAIESGTHRRHLTVNTVNQSKRLLSFSVVAMLAYTHTVPQNTRWVHLLTSRRLLYRRKATVARDNTSCSAAVCLEHSILNTQSKLQSLWSTVLHFTRTGLIHCDTRHFILLNIWKSLRWKNQDGRNEKGGNVFRARETSS